jgi:hypothetical protein
MGGSWQVAVAVDDSVSDSLWQVVSDSGSEWQCHMAVVAVNKYQQSIQRVSANQSHYAKNVSLAAAVINKKI